MKKTKLNILMIFCALGIAACSGKKPPVEAMTRANMTVKRADQPKILEAAPLEMRVAREKLEQARKDMDKKDYDAARRNAEDATIQAELAESKANLKETTSKTKDAQQGLKTLESEIEHSNGRGN